MNSEKIFLLIDNNPDDCTSFREAIKEIDSRMVCLISRNCEEALDMLREGNRLPDYIFLDLNMDRMDGKTCLAELKKDKLLKNIPVIIYSTSDSQKDIDETQKLGAAHFLTKPHGFQNMITQIVFVLETDWLVGVS